MAACFTNHELPTLPKHPRNIRNLSCDPSKHKLVYGLCLDGGSMGASNDLKNILKLIYTQEVSNTVSKYKVKRVLGT